MSVSAGYKDGLIFNGSEESLFLIYLFFIYKFYERIGF